MFLLVRLGLVHNLGSFLKVLLTSAAKRASKAGFESCFSSLILLQAKLDAQTEQMAKLQQAAEAKAPAVAQAAVDFAGMSASGNDFGCIALAGGVDPTLTI